MKEEIGSIRHPNHLFSKISDYFDMLTLPIITQEELWNIKQKILYKYQKEVDEIQFLGENVERISYTFNKLNEVKILDF